MLNQVVIVGRLVKDPEITEVEKEIKLSRITLAVPRSYKNINGEYETDFVPCTLWRGIAENTATYCKKGDLVGIKGRIQSSAYEKDDKKIYSIDVIAEKVTFLSSKDKKEEK
jgi:single-strand DNA-binding protein